jgi:hypothetical protein
MFKEIYNKAKRAVKVARCYKDGKLLMFNRTNRNNDTDKGKSKGRK